MLLKGTLVPSIFAAPSVHVTLPSETVLDSAGAGGADPVSRLHPRTANRRVHPMMYAIFIAICCSQPNEKTHSHRTADVQHKTAVPLRRRVN